MPAGQPRDAGATTTMLSGRITHATIRILDWIARRTLPPDSTAEHLRTGRRGEEDAYFHLRKLGYVMVARNFRASPQPARRNRPDRLAPGDPLFCRSQDPHYPRCEARRSRG
jgi:hypothetical protein